MISTCISIGLACYIRDSLLVMMFFYILVLLSISSPSFFSSRIFQHVRHICAPLTTARAPVYLTRKLPSSCLTYLLYCHHQIFICKGEDLWMVAFRCFTHTPSVFLGEFHTIALHIYRVLHVFTWVSKKKKRLWVLATINFPTPGGGFRSDTPQNRLKTTRGQWCSKDLLLMPGTSTQDRRNSATLDAHVSSRWDGIFCEGEKGYNGRNISNKEIWGKERGWGKNSKRCLNRNLEGMIYIYK